MKTHHDLLIVIVVLILATTGGILFFTGLDVNKQEATTPPPAQSGDMMNESMGDTDMMEDAMPAGMMGDTDEMMAEESPVKEFAMTAYYDPVAKKPFFSLDQIEVKRGDEVRIRVTNTMGMHDFTLDEFGVKTELPLNQEVVVEFTADKAGDFVYYCSKPGHRQAGQWGTLRVVE